ncbi:hypothetical protein BKA65DRAFT_567473 [Rhexocercosporidium sp. MPI-PUGE-AT-0058]|nr:hypothetical protein BKA65DRAFT_567473 [Rhexocercosporidium sp. MPI-PUGE-AT-0058]
MDVKPGEHSKPPQSLQFINITDKPESQKGEFAITVRSHARRSFVYRKRSPKPKQTRTQTPRPTSGPGSEGAIEDPHKLQGKFKLNTWSTKPRRKGARKIGEKAELPVPIVLKHVSLQPYERAIRPTSIKNSPRTSAYPNIQVTTAFTRNIFAINYDSSWNIYDVTDSAVLHVTCCMISQNRDILSSTDDSPDTLYHKGEMMKIMSLRLTETSHKLGDADIFSVAVLVILESIQGTSQAATAHRVGLQRMVNLRGGYQSFKHSPLMLRLLAWTDIAYSIRFATSPAFPCLFTSSIMADNPLPKNTSNPSLTMVPSLQSDSETALIVSTLRKISLTIDLPNLTLDDKKIVVSDLYNIQYRLLSSLNSPSTSGACDLDYAFRIASLVYLNHFIREQSNRARLHDNLLSRLAAILKSMRWDVEFSGWASDSDSKDVQWKKDLLMWIVFVALAASRDDVMRIGFIAALRTAGPEFLRLGLDEVKARHRRVAWSESKCSEALDEIWNAIIKEGFGLRAEYLEA